MRSELEPECGYIAVEPISDPYGDTDLAFMAAKGIVEVNGRMLVYTRDEYTAVFSGSVDLLGGGREPGESAFDNFSREVAEEVKRSDGSGLVVPPESIAYAVRYCVDEHAGIGIDVGVPPNSYGVFMVSGLQLPELEAQQLVLGDEGRQLEQLTPDEYLALPNAWPVFQQLVRQYYGVKSLICDTADQLK